MTATNDSTGPAASATDPVQQGEDLGVNAAPIEPPGVAFGDSAVAGPSIPDLPDPADQMHRWLATRPYARAAKQYRDHGWRGVLPMPRGEEAKRFPPTGYTGRSGGWPDDEQVAGWVSTRGGDNIAIRLPPGVLGVDVDAYEGKAGGQTLTKMEADSGRLLATWRSSSRAADPVSGIRWFRAELPEGKRWRGEAGPGIELVHFGHRYAMVAPSVHPKTGQPYQWFGPDGERATCPRPDDLPELSPEWIEALTVPDVERPDETPYDGPPKFTEGQPGTKYGLAGLRRELAKLRKIWDDDIEAFNPQLNRSAFAIGQLAGGGELDAGHARSEMEGLMAELAVPDDQHGTLESGFTSGMAKPRSAPPDELPDAPTVPAESEGDTWPRPDQAMPVARRLAAQFQYEGHLTLRYWRGGWLRWDGARWGDVDADQIDGWIYTELEHAQFEVPDKGPGGVVTMVRKDWNPTKSKVQTARDALAKGVTQLLADHEPPAWLDDGHDESPREVVSCANGLLHVPTGKLMAATPQFFTNTSVPFDYDPAAPEPRQWLAFLRQLWPGDPRQIATLQEWFGYVLSGRVDLQKMLLLIGPPRSGKGTVGRVLSELVGRGNTASPRLSSLGSEFGLMSLVSKPLAIVGDARLNPGMRDLDQVVEVLLAITGEDPVTVHRKYLKPWEGRLPTRFVIMSNEVPVLKDASGALPNRFIPLLMTRSFLGEEDNELTVKLLTELPGILNWSLEGFDRLTRTNRFTLADTSRELLGEVVASSSRIRAFIEDRCQVGEGKRVRRDDLYAAYKMWAEVNDEKGKLSREHFGRDLKAAFPAVQTKRETSGSRKWYHLGIGLDMAEPTNQLASGQRPS